MHLILWEFVSLKGKEREFEQVYGSNGDWARLFGRSAEYRGTDLLRSADGRTYITIDRWTSADSFAEFQNQWRRDYQAMDQRSEALTERETLIGRFETG